RENAVAVLERPCAANRSCDLAVALTLDDAATDGVCDRLALAGRPVANQRRPRLAAVLAAQAQRTRIDRRANLVAGRDVEIPPDNMRLHDLGSELRLVLAERLQVFGKL